MAKFLIGDRVYVDALGSWGTVQGCGRAQVVVFLDATATTHTFELRDVDWCPVDANGVGDSHRASR